MNNKLNDLVERIQQIFALNNISVHSDAIETAILNNGTNADADKNDLIETLKTYCNASAELESILIELMEV